MGWCSMLASCGHRNCGHRAQISQALPFHRPPCLFMRTAWTLTTQTWLATRTFRRASLNMWSKAVGELLQTPQHKHHEQCEQHEQPHEQHEHHEQHTNDEQQEQHAYQ